MYILTDSQKSLYASTDKTSSMGMHHSQRGFDARSLTLIWIRTHLSLSNVGFSYFRSICAIATLTRDPWLKVLSIELEKAQHAEHAFECVAIHGFWMPHPCGSCMQNLQTVVHLFG